MLQNQLHDLHNRQSSQQTRTPIELSKSLYGNIHGWVSHEALRKVEEQLKRLKKPDLPGCTGVFTKTLSLPCAHTLKAVIRNEEALQLHHFHTHWHLQREGEPQLIIQPRKRFDQLSAQSTLPKTSTQREPSSHEAVEKALQPKAKPTCSRCHVQGHSMNQKACPLRYAHLSVDTASLEASQSTPELVEMTLKATTALSAAQKVTNTLPTAPEVIPTSPGDVFTSPEVTPAPESRPALPTPTVTRLEDLPRSHPCNIYARYIADREKWYKSLPPSSLKTNQQYRKAKKLPQRFSKKEYEWCLDYKEMGKLCKITKPHREWKKEEMMAYLDFDKAEEERVHTKTAQRVAVERELGLSGVEGAWAAVNAEDQEDPGAMALRRRAEEAVRILAESL